MRDFSEIGAKIRLPNGEEFEYNLSHIEYLSSIDDVWMKRDGLVFFPFDRNQDAIFYPEVKGSKEFEEKIFKRNDVVLSEEYQTTVFLAQDAIRNEDIRKIVIARNDITKNNTLLPQNIYNKSKSIYPDSFVFMVNVGQEIWVGASPELLMEYKDNQVKTVALAGTKLLSEDFSEKEKEEQLMVEEFIEEKLHISGFSNIEKEKGELTYADIKHIQTKYQADGDEEKALTLLKHLQPTSAVCGLPRDKSFYFLQNYEGMDRSFYSGVTGMLKNGQVTFFVNLRCMRIYENEIELFAGAGITADSSPLDEWKETEHKIKTIKKML